MAAGTKVAGQHLTTGSSPVVPGKHAPLRIGLSARLLHEPPPELGFRNKRLQYIEQTIAHWIMAEGALAFMLPTLESAGALRRSAVHVSDFVRAIDGLVLQGGADVSPTSYGEEPIRPEWRGDRVRDLYELDLIWECIIQGKPVLGICRGCQLLNVAFGGSLWQDVETQIEGSAPHVDSEAYDQHVHSIRFAPGSVLERLYPLDESPKVTSIHHQAVKQLGAGLTIEALADNDDVIEAVRWNGNCFVYGVQWHPEFHLPGSPDLLDPGPLLGEFLRQAATRAGIE